MSDSSPPTIEALGQTLAAALRADGVALAASTLERFARDLRYSWLLRNRGPKRLARPKLDILDLIEAAEQQHQPDEVVWRVFLAAHFGRLSATGVDAESAGLFLCGFVDSPRWTWEVVASDRGAALEAWLRANPRISNALGFGNHRKHEDKKVDGLMEVIGSFIGLAGHCDGPSNIVVRRGVSPGFDQFDQLFQRIQIHRFGRLGNWDFIDVLAQLKLTTAVPKHCYLHGATGPLKGATRLWGDHSEDVLNVRCARLVQRLPVSGFVLEDALCNLQKDGDSCCGDPDPDGACTA